LRGSAFGLLAGIQSAGDFIASAVVGLLWTLVSPTLAFGFAAALMIGALVTMVIGHRPYAPELRPPG
jgi:dipeptide/tripeptide permease